MEFVREVISLQQSLAASAIATVDLPVNPISHLVLSLEGDNVTDEATLAETLARITEVQVLYRGGAILSLSGDQLFAVSAILNKGLPIFTNQVATDNDKRSVSFIIPFGRKLLDQNEAFFATKRGELQFRISISATATAIDGITYTLEAITMPSAHPRRFMKITALQREMTSGADNDFPLPIGNVYAGILMDQDTGSPDTAMTYTIDEVSLLADGKEKYLAGATSQNLHAELQRLLGHSQDTDASADNDDLAGWLMADFGLDGRDDFLFETAGLSDLKLVIAAGAADTAFVFPVELVSVARFA